MILRQVDHLKHDFQEQADGDAGHIRIFANTTAVTEFMPDLLARYLAGHPGVTVDLQERLTRDIVRGVRDGTTDLGIVAGPVDAPELQAIHFSTDRLVLVTPNGHPLQDRAKVKLTEAVSHPFITMHEGSTLVAFLREQLEMAGQRLPQRIQLYSFDSICRMVQAGVGVGVIPDSAARRYGASQACAWSSWTNPGWCASASCCCATSTPCPARELIAQIQESRDESGDTARPDEAVRASAKPRAAAKTPAARTPAARTQAAETRAAETQAARPQAARSPQREGPAQVPVNAGGRFRRRRACLPGSRRCIPARAATGFPGRTAPAYCRWTRATPAWPPRTRRPAASVASISASVAASASSGTARQIRPQASACRALTDSPNNAAPIARAEPTNRGRNQVPPASGNRPILLKACTKRADSTA